MADDWTVTGETPATSPPSLPTVNVTADPWKVVKEEPAPQRTGLLDAAGSRIMDSVYGVGQLMSHLDPGVFTSKEDTAAIDANMKRRREQLDRERNVPSATVAETTLDQQGRATHTRPRAERGNPAATLGDIGGEIANPLNYAAPARALGVGTLARRVGSAAIQGGLTGIEQPATNTGYWTEKAAQFGAGAVTGSVLPAIGQAGRALKDWVWATASRFGKSPEDRATSKALQTIHGRMSKDIQGGGPTAQDMLDILNLTPNKPLGVMDVGGEGVLGLAGKVIRQPGAARQGLTSTINDRDRASTARLSADIDNALASDDVNPSQAVQGLRQARSIAAKPLWDKAMAGGSIAPLKQQFQDAYVEVGRAEKDAQRRVADAQQQITIATAKQHRAGNDVYLVNSANQDLRAAQAQLQQAQGDLTHQSEVRSLILGMVNDAQADIDANVPGAVWSPRIAEALRQPEIRQGIQSGVKLERQKAFKEGRPMNLGEYAIKGMDENGDPIVGKVPTMKLLAVAKQGLDSELEKSIYHDELTGGLNQAGIHLDGMRRGFLEELDRLNPDYAAARAQWSGDTASMQAVRYGERQWMNKRPEEIADDIANMTPGDQEFARLGLAANLRKQMAKMGGSGNEARAVAGDKPGAWLRLQIQPFFRNEAEYKTFIDSVDAENRMFLRQYEIRGNSKTAARIAEDSQADTFGHLAGGAVAAARGHVLPLAYHGTKVWERMKGNIPEDVASQIGVMLSDPAKALQVLGGYKGPTGPIQRYSPYATGPAAALTEYELGLQ
jgi:hypothetical protein